MAASAPPPTAPPGYFESDKSSTGDGGNSESLEFVMSGLSLIPGLSRNGVDATTGDTSTSTSPPQNHTAASSRYARNSEGVSGNTHNSAPGSPLEPNSLTTDPLPSSLPAFGSGGFSSTRDGSSEQYGVVRRSSGLYNMSSNNNHNNNQQQQLNSSRQMDQILRTSSSDGNGQRSHSTNRPNNFDAVDGDGLLGLDSLRDRAHSSPGPPAGFSSSPTFPVQMPPHNQNDGNAFQEDLLGTLVPDQRRPRAASRDNSRPAHSSRPPLSRGNSSSMSPSTEGATFHDGKMGAPGLSFSNPRGQESNSSSLYQDVAGLGVISRPEFRHSVSPSDAMEKDNATLRRSMSETGREPLYNGGYDMYQNNGSTLSGGQGNNDYQSDQLLSQKMGGFSSMMNPHSQASQMSMYQSQSRASQSQRHQRSFSQPGPARNNSNVEQYSAPDDRNRRGDGDYGSGMVQHQLGGMDNDYGVPSSDMYYNNAHSMRSGETRYIPHGRSMSMTHGGMSSDTLGGGGGGNGPSGGVGRSMSMTHGGMSSEMLGGGGGPTAGGGHGHLHGHNHGHTHGHAQRRSSQPSMGSSGGYFKSGQSMMQNIRGQRRASLDFDPSHSRYPDSGMPVMAGEEKRLYSDAEYLGNNAFNRHERLVSPAQSPIHHVNYGHNRHPSEVGTTTTMSSSPMSLGSSGMRGMQNQNHDLYGSTPRSHRRVSSTDDDLTHPLVGEHIDVSGDDMPYRMNDSGVGHSMMRRHSIDQMLPSYGNTDPSHHLPTAGSALPLPKVVYNVKFKRTQRCFVLGPRINRDLRIGTYVKVEADRGEDLGIVVGKIPAEKYNLSARTSYRGGLGEMGIMPPTNGLGAADLKSIIRLATHDEVSLLAIKKEEEEELLKICRGKVRQRGLMMNVVDAEYQFDRHKLTFFFEAEGRIDFRELVRDLFSMYKTRIWMQQLDKNTGTTAPGISPPPPSMMDFGTPIIAPASEFSDFAPLNGASSDAGGE